MAASSRGLAAFPSNNEEQRRQEAYRLRLQAALADRIQPLPDHVSNGDESRYAARWGNFSKALPHNALGEVDPNAYTTLLNALASSSPAEMEKVLMGASDPSAQMKLVNPLSGVAFDMEGMDSHALSQPPAPALSSAEAAGEMVELCWMALLRDIPFTDYAASAAVQSACDELSKLSDFRGPKVNGKVTPQTLFRGFTAGDTVGPYISQFLVRPVQYGAQMVDQKIRTFAPGSDHLTDYASWLAAQNGNLPSVPNQFDNRMLLRNPRDMAAWVHMDVLFQAYFNAANILMMPPDPGDPLTGGGMGATPSASNPYRGSKTQVGFGTFGGPFFAAMVPEPSTRALKAVWFQKWFVHRRLRPEEFGGLVHNQMAGKGAYPIHADVLQSAALNRIKTQFGAWLLPQAFPEGCPIHPSYGAGHATVAGACVTMLKAMFDESFPIANPVQVSSDGQTLVPYTGADASMMTVGGELNKLAANVAIGRNMAGVHYRSDYTESLRLGEKVAIRILQDVRHTFGETFNGFSFTSFDGAKVNIT
ncbi:MAG: vanadium-dependent haloperoxidase [Acidobacteriia bacterium]|nr:vanadium-dependent haloperoxidase [Terriglobia bacterium]